MKLFEYLLFATITVLLIGIAGLGLLWGGRAVSMGLFGSPVAEDMRAATRIATPDAATPADTEAQAAQETAAPAAQTVSLAAGEKVFKKCKACHSIDAAAKHKSGPALWSVIGRPIGSAVGFGFSDALAGLGDQTWDVDTLSQYLANPKAFAPGNKMSFAGLKKPEDIRNIIAYMGQNADTPLDAAALGFPAAPVPDAGTEAEAEASTEVVEIDPVPYPDGVTYRNPPARSAEIAALTAELEALAPTLDYERARYHPLHFPPAAAQASNEECLVCHQEILSHEPRATAPAGRAVGDTIAWYQTLDTYAGDQQSFHYRHLQSEFAREVMNLECSFCHNGTDPREESPDMVPTRAALTAPQSPEFTLRKMVNPSETCLRCHGAFPEPEIMGLDGPWHEVRADMEWPEAPNGCLSCHAESFRTVRHDVDYLRAANIEALAREGSSDSCYGCHGGRSWYRIAYPYPRHAWPDMDPQVPDWAVDRPTRSDPAHALPASEPASE